MLNFKYSTFSVIYNFSHDIDLSTILQYNLIFVYLLMKIKKKKIHFYVYNNS